MNQILLFAQFYLTLMSRLAALASRYAEDRLTPDTFGGELSATLLDAHTEAATIGRSYAGGSPQRSNADVQLAGRVMSGGDAPSGSTLALLDFGDGEQSYIDGFVTDLKAGKYLGEPDDVLPAIGASGTVTTLTQDTAAIKRRAQAYAGRTIGTANYAWLSGLDPNTLITWTLGTVENHCMDCVYLAANSPYTLATLPTTPGANDTRCLYNCDCSISTDGGEVGFSLPVAEKPNKSMAFKRWVTIHGHHVEINDEDGGGDSSGDSGGSKVLNEQAAEKEQKPSAATKSELAKQSAVYVGAEIQRYSEEHNEPILAAGTKGLSLRDNEPIDVLVVRKGVIKHGIELKTMVSNANNKITMKADAMARKQKWVNENNAPYHTVVFDDQKVFNATGFGQHDDSKRVIYYRRGFGSFRVGGMHKVKNMKELNGLLEMADADLPAAAKPSAGYKPPAARAA